MGNMGSAPIKENDDIWWTNGRRNVDEAIVEDKIVQDSSQNLNSAEPEPHDFSLNQLSDENKEKLNDFKFEMERKHEKRREILAAKKKEFEDLREEVRRLKEENENIKSLKSKSNDQTPEELSKAVQQLKEENDSLKVQLSLKKSGAVLLEEIDKLLRENTTLKDQLKDKVEELEKTAVILDKNRELRINIAEMQNELQSLNAVVVEFEKEREEYKAHVVALKDVIQVSKKMLLIRESQLKELREKVECIEESLSGKEMNILSQDLRLEYERQLQSIRNLKRLYEERQISDHKEKEELKRVLEETKKELQTEKDKNKESEERINDLEQLNSQKYDEIKSLESNLGLAKAECRQYQAELTVINQLFSEILLGFNSSQEIDLVKLTKHLEDHHDLLQNIVINEICSEASSALPKVLLDLVNQVNGQEEKTNKNVEDCLAEDESGRKLETIVEESESQTSTDQINSAEEIVELLPKVWRVLIELLSHQKAPINTLTTEEHTDENPCYKTVQTPKGPSLVLSVSQTFIRLKDLILEKKSLEKETGHLKQLNTHLESRLQDQEKRLEMVSSELNKTWHVVGKLQKQHHLLHTQEKILRYELAQKRKLLTTLKEELEYSREKWQQAREKNSKTEKQWRQLRVEFASRRNTMASDNSQESGYSDERGSSSDDEPGYETDVSESTPKQTEGADEEEENSCETKTLLNASTETEDQIASIVESLVEESLMRDSENLQDNATITENETELENSAIQARFRLSNLRNAETKTAIIEVEEINDADKECPHVGNSKQNIKTRINGLVDSEKEIALTRANYDEETSSEEATNLQNSMVRTENLIKLENYDTIDLRRCKPVDVESETLATDQSPSLLERTSSCLVSTVIEEAVQAILKNSEQSTGDTIRSTNETALTNSKTGYKKSNNEKKNFDSVPGTSSVTTEAMPKTLEELLAAKEERLKRLEGQCEQLVRKVTNTAHKSITIANKLDNLHEAYAESSNSQDTVSEVKEENNCNNATNNNQG